MEIRKIFGVLVLCASAPAAFSNVITPGNSGSPDVFTGQTAGTLLATLVSPFTTLGTGSVESAVYRNVGGTLDFYYQVTLTSGIPILSLAATDFTGFATDVGYRTDGSTVPVAGFVNGSVAPSTVARSVAGDRVTFSGMIVNGGNSTYVLEIQTDATQFAAGHLTLANDGGSLIQASFQPLATTPEPGSLLLMAGGIAALAWFARRLI